LIKSCLFTNEDSNNLNFMKFRFLLISLLLLFALAVSENANAQKKKSYLKKRNRMVSKYKGGSIHFSKNKRYLSGEFNINFNNYFGDLAPQSGRVSTDLSFTRPGVGIYAVYRYTPNLSFRTGLSWSRIKGDDYESADPNEKESLFRYARNLSFRNNLYEFSFQGMWDILGNYGTFLNRVPFTPYVFAGVSVFYHEPKGLAPDLDRNGNPLPEAGEWVKLRPLGTEGQFSTTSMVKGKEYGPIQFSVPAGIGFRAQLNKRFDFAFEIGYKFLFFDYIDDVSGLYVDLGSLDGELAKVMSDRSLEQTAVISGDQRDFEKINTITREISYVSKYDGNTYNTLAGYGHEFPDNLRGNSSDNDHILVTSIKLTYILTGSFQRAKFR